MIEKPMLKVINGGTTADADPLHLGNSVSVVVSGTVANLFEDLRDGREHDDAIISALYKTLDAVKAATEDPEVRKKAFAKPLTSIHATVIGLTLTSSRSILFRDRARLRDTRRT